MRVKVVGALIMTFVALAGSTMSRADDASDCELGFSLGILEPRADTGLWASNRREFTGDEQDFDGLLFGVRVGWPINDHFELDAGGSYYEAKVHLQYWFAYDRFDRPITHTTRFALRSLAGDIRYVPFGGLRSSTGGEGNGRARLYLGVGGGALGWEYEERGRFVTGRVAHEVHRARGITFEAHGLAGLEVDVAAKVGVFLEWRIWRAKDDLSDDFPGFEDLDLTGESVSMGTRLRL